jgi:tellurite resistance protein
VVTFVVNQIEFLKKKISKMATLVLAVAVAVAVAEEEDPP